MRKLNALGLVQPLRDYAASGRPFLGVCVGLQLLLDWSQEGGGVECMGILPGVVRRFPNDPVLKVPQIGWNTVSQNYEHPLLDDIPDNSYFYFVHSYYAEASDAQLTLGQANFGLDFAAIVARDNVVATQFHPEKSSDLGLRLYRNFARIASRSYQQSDVSPQQLVTASVDIPAELTPVTIAADS
jgi:glutamine amidotransferase